ncbi:MAG TPA: hydroxyisourate hydrolase [Steroidobacteraceae bacterium]|nr:hydroxyisourate hydrolase [Steroidobacteraceae bacterium]
MGRLTTHVLDQVSGMPAAGMTVELVALEGGRRRPVVQLATNRDGRCEGPLVEGERFTAGIWQLEFHVATYYRMQGVALPDPPFLDVVTIRFGVADATHHYHVPLLVTPWSYSTYRGS